MKTVFSISLLGMLFLLSGCIPTATVVGTDNPPPSYVFSPGYNPPQTAYPDYPTDADPYTGQDESVMVIQQENDDNTLIALPQTDQSQSIMPVNDTTTW